MRKAMVALVNQQTYLQAMFGNPDLYESCGSYFACGTYLATDAGAESLLADDPAKAARMFKDAGYDGSPITVMQPTDVATMNTAALVTAQLMRDAGLNVQLLPLDTASIGQRRANKGAPADGGWNILFTWWNGIDLSSPITNTPLQASCDKAWPGWPCDEELQGLIDAYLTVSTPEEQKALAETIQLRAFEVVPYINFGQWQQPVAYSNKLDGVLQVPGAVVFWNIAKT
jgi:peptide/nickel transport system substrate-binding protein